MKKIFYKYVEDNAMKQVEKQKQNILFVFLFKDMSYFVTFHNL